MQITVIGSCANQVANREGVSLLVEGGGYNKLLIDCGPGIVSALGKCNKLASDINHLFLTHVHADHIAGFPYFVWNRIFERLGKDPAQDLYVYGQKDTLEYAKFTIEHSYPELNFPFKVHYIETSPNKQFMCGEMEITPIEAIHTVPCIGCIIKRNGKKIVYTADSMYNEKLIEKAIDTDLLIYDGMMNQQLESLALKTKHDLAGNAGIFASKTNTKLLLLVHVAPFLIGQEHVLLGEAKKHYNGIVAVPHDGCVYML